MNSVSTSEAAGPHAAFRCISCGDLTHGASQDFRCAHCGDLLEITYPRWKESKPDAASLKTIWRDRQLSSNPVDLSGVWRFRDLLPPIESGHQAITLREG